MNKRLTTIFMTLLLCILGATNAWAQSSKVYVYSNNLTFINPSNSSYYAGVAKEYRVYNEVAGRFALYGNADSGILSKLVNSNYVVKIMVPAGTKYLHFHIMGGSGRFKVRSGLDTYMEEDLPDPSSILDTSSSSDVTFTERPGIPFYKVVTFSNPLEQNTQITFISKVAFFVFGINYEDLDGKGTSANPFTAGEAYALARDHVKPTGKVYVKGMVSTASQLADGKLSFSLSDDGSHENEIAVSNCLNIDGENFESEYQVLPRDKVTLQCNISTPTNQSLTNGKLISQVHPKYAAIVERNGTRQFYAMVKGGGDNYVDHSFHSLYLGHLAAGVGSNFYFEETYSDDTSYRKSFYGPASSSNYYSIGWENMDNVPLIADTGSKMCVNTDGDNYSLFLQQVEDGPKLTVGGFENPRFFLHRESDTAILAELELGSDFVYRARGIDVQTGEGLYITKGENGSEFYCSLKDSYLISQDNCANLPVATSGQIRNFKMSVTGTFDFSFFVDTSNGSATFSVSPSWGEWPEPRPIYWLCYNDNGDVMLKFHDNGNGTYTLTDSGLSEEGSGFWFKRQLGDGPIEQYAGSVGTNMRLHKYNSTYVDLIAGGSDFKMAGNASEKTFTITETAEGPVLTITGWPETYLSFAYDPGSGPSQVGVFGHDEETDTYSFTYTVSKTGGFYFIDTAFGVPFSATTEEAFILSRHNSTDILATFDGSPYFKTINDGTYTFKLTPFNDSYLLTVEGWPEPIYKVDGRNGQPFVKNEDGSYSTTINVTEEMIAQHEDYSFDIYEETEDKYYGTILVEGGLNRYNCVDLPLGTGERYYNITLYEAGEYTLTISPDFKLSIGWPHKDYYLNYRPADPSITPSTVPFEYYAGNYTVSDILLREGYEFYVQDAEGRGFGIQTTDDRPVVYESNSSNMNLVEGGKIAAISQIGNYTFTMRESDSSADYDLQLDITGWAERTWAIRFLNGTSYTDVPLVYDSQEGGYKMMTSVKEGRKFVVADNFGFTFGVPSSTTIEGNNLVRLFEDIDENTDYMQMQTSGTYTFLVAEDDRGMYIRVSTMGNLIAGGDAESGATGYFLMKETPNSTIQDARVVEGAGKDGSKAFVIHSVANPTQEWDTQFFIELSQPLPEGTKFRISFDYKADLYASGVTTHTHGEPGEYITYTAIGNVDFADYWRHFEYEGTVSHTQSPTCNMRTIAFMLAKTTDANTLYFDNIEVEIAEGAPVMVDIIKNGNIEADDMSCFKKIEQVGNHPGELVTANFTEGVGKNGTRGIVVQSRDNPDPSGVLNDWDTQFFVRLPQTLPAGTKYRISFDYRANKEATAYTQMHAEPANYLNYTGIGNVNFNIGWQHFEQSGIITNAQSPQDNMQTICFCLAVKKSATTYYFDNIVFEIDEDHVAQVLPGDVNGDGTVTIQDVVAIVDYTLGKGSSAFNEKAADVTGDGQINVSDVVGVVNILLGKSN
jgi:hypothetical protein